MKLYCKHCGKEIEDTDKFCKYCGGNLSDESNTNIEENNNSNQKFGEIDEPNNKKKGFFARFRKGARDENGKYVSKTVLEDRVYEERTIIKENHIQESNLYSLDDIVLIKRGNKKSLLTKNLLATILCLVGAIGLAIVAIISRTYISSDTVAYLVLFGSIIVMFAAFAWFIETFYNFRGLQELKENEIIVKKYGLKKPAELMLNGEIYEIILTTDCSMCDREVNGDVIGDLHLEKIEEKLIAVCNINRRHIWHVDEKSIIDGLSDNTITVLNKGEKPIIKKSADTQINQKVIEKDTPNETQDLDKD